MVPETYMKLSVTGPDFLYFFYLQNWKNIPKTGPKQGFSNLLKNLVIHFYWIRSIMKIYIICCFCADPIFDQIFVPEISAKMFSANQIAGFFKYISRKHQ